MSIHPGHDTGQASAPRRSRVAVPQIYSDLRSQIVSIALKPGAWLSEARIAEQYGVSRTPVREAFKRLAEDGFLDVVPQVGTYVARIDMQAVRDAHFVRETLECRIVELAAERIDDAQRAELLRNLRELELAQRGGDREAHFRADESMHAMLARIAGHAYAWDVIQEAKAQLDRIRHLGLTRPGRPRETVLEHRAIAERVIAGDAKGAAAGWTFRARGRRRRLRSSRRRRSLKPSRIVAIRATPVTVPLEAPLLHSNGAHWGRFVRTLVEVETDDGLVGLGEFGGGGESATAAVEGLIGYLKGHDPFRLEAMRFAICNPTASLYNNRTQIHAALEFACLDIMGQKLGVSVSELLGGRIRDEIPFASYLFFRYGDADGRHEVRTPDQLAAQARALKASHGFGSHKLKGGVYPPCHELECYRALADAVGGDRIRYDPNSALSLGDAIEFGRAIEGLNNDYYEDPVWGMPQLSRLREFVRIPTATNTVVINFEQLAANVAQRAVDVILLDTTFWGGIRPCIKAAGICETFGLGVAVHSSGELGVQLATMLHMGAVVPNLSYAADAHYHHLTDDVIEGGPMRYRDGAIAVPEGPGLGVKLDRAKVRRYHELFLELGGYPYDRDPGRPGWYPLVPNVRWADPAQRLAPDLGVRR